MSDFISFHLFVFLLLESKSDLTVLDVPAQYMDDGGFFLSFWWRDGVSAVAFS